MIDGQLSANRFLETDQRLGLKEFTPSAIGLPAYMDDFCQSRGDFGGVTACQLPRINFGGNLNGNFYQVLGDNSGTFDQGTHYQGQLNLTQVRGSHTLRAGTDFRRHERFRNFPGNASGNFTFDNTYTRKADDTTESPAANLGLGWAAFMLGIPTRVEAEMTASSLISNHWVGTFFQDTWRVSESVTLNFGLRHEYETGLRDKNDQMLVGFDPNADVAIAQLAEAAYATKPDSATCAERLRRARRNRLRRRSGPDGPELGRAIDVDAARVGLLDDQRADRAEGRLRHVLRRAECHELHAQPDRIQRDHGQRGERGFRSDLAAGRPEGAASRRCWIRSPCGPTARASTRRSAARSASTRRSARVSRLRILIACIRACSDGARACSARSAATWLSRSPTTAAGAIGSIARSGRTTCRKQYWNGSNVRDITQQNLLNANVTNPFLISNFESLRTSNPALYNQMAGNSFFTSPTIQRHRLLRPFPHMSSGDGLDFQTLPLGENRAHSLEVSFNRRFANGFTANVFYTATRFRENRTVEEYDREPTIWQHESGRAAAPHDGRLHRRAPVRHLEAVPERRRRARRDPERLAGRRDVRVAARRAARVAGNIFFYGDLDDIKLDNPTIDRWFNTDAGFEKDPAKVPANFQKRAFPFRIDGVRAPGLKHLNMNVGRTMRLPGNRTLQLRVDALNVLQQRDLCTTRT